jgi:hypothetical protein
MMAGAQEFLDREAAAWSAFDALVNRVPAERREVPGVVGEWSLKMTVWHCAHWVRFTVDTLAALGDEPFVDPFDAESDEHWDEVNDDVARVGASMSWDDVRAGAESAHADVRAAVATASPEAVAWAGAETFEHYEEHGEDIRRSIEA